MNITYWNKHRFFKKSLDLKTHQKMQEATSAFSLFYLFILDALKKKNTSM